MHPTVVTSSRRWKLDTMEPSRYPPRVLRVGLTPTVPVRSPLAVTGGVALRSLTTRTREYPRLGNTCPTPLTHRTSISGSVTVTTGTLLAFTRIVSDLPGHPGFVSPRPSTVRRARAGPSTNV